MTSPQRVATTSPHRVATTTPHRVATTSPHRVATTSPHHVATPYYPAGSPTHPNVTTSSIATFSNGIIDGALVPPTYCNAATSGVQLPDFSQQILQDMGSLGPELDAMLQANSGAAFQEQWPPSTTPEWNFDGLVSDSFFSANTASVNFGLGFSTAGGYESCGPTFGEFALPPSSPQKLPVLPPAPSDNDSSFLNGIFTFTIMDIVSYLGFCLH